jgi:hypothetical protein
MSKVYVAGKDIARAGAVMDAVRTAGHEITYDWATDYSEENPRAKAEAERDGVESADMLVYLWESDQESARYEAGMAMGQRKPVVVSGNTEAFFFGLADVHPVGSDDEIVSRLKELV